MAKRVNVSWEFPAGYFFKCVLKVLREKGLSSGGAAHKFKRLVPCYQEAFDADRALRGKARVVITHNRIEQRAHKGSFEKNRSEWPDLNPASNIYWDVAQRVVAENRPLDHTALLKRLKSVPPIAVRETVTTVPRSRRLNRPHAPSAAVRDVQARLKRLEEEVARLKGSAPVTPTLPVTKLDLEQDELSLEMFESVRRAVQLAYWAKKMKAAADWTIASDLQVLAPECQHYVRNWGAISEHLNLPKGWTQSQAYAVLAGWASVE